MYISQTTARRVLKIGLRPTWAIVVVFTRTQSSTQKVLSFFFKISDQNTQFIVYGYFVDDEYPVGDDSVVVPIAAIQLCGFVLGEPVIVRCGPKTFVKHIWPSDDLSLSNVYFSKEGYYSEIKINNNNINSN